MMRNSLSHASGAALYRYAKERGKEEEAYASLRSLSASLQEEPLLLTYFRNPAVDTARKKERLDRLLSALPSYFRAWAALCLRKAREGFDPEAALEGFREPYDDDRGYRRGLVYSARPLLEEEKAKLKAALGGEKVALTYKVDPSLIGGYRIYIDGRLIERSLDGKLDEARRMLLSEED